MNAKRGSVKKKSKPGTTEKVDGLSPSIIATVIVGVLSCTGTIAGSFIAADNSAQIETVVSCPAELDKALEVRRENPTVDITYTGELETQCQLNSAIRQIPAPAPAPAPLPAP